MKHFQREDSDYETVETSYSGEWVILPWEAELLKVSGGPWFSIGGLPTSCLTPPWRLSLRRLE